MAVFKAVVRFKRPDGFYPVYIRVTHQRKAQYIKTDKMVDQKGVDKSNGIKDPYVMKYCANKISRFVEILNISCVLALCSSFHLHIELSGLEKVLLSHFFVDLFGRFD